MPKKIQSTDPNTPLKQGQKASFIPQEFELNKMLQQFKSTPEAMAKAEELLKQIEAHKKELEALKKKQKQIAAKQANLKKQHKAAQPHDQQTINYVNMVLRDCTQAVDAFRKSNRLLYRGMHDTPGSVFRGMSRDDRSPTDSSNKDQEIVDNVLKLAGFSALRGNSIFCSGSINQAASYGDAYIIIPKDGFQFTWSSKHQDFYSSVISNYHGGARKFAQVNPPKAQNFNPLYKVFDKIGTVLQDMPDSYESKAKTLATKLGLTTPQYQAQQKVMWELEGDTSDILEYLDDLDYNPHSSSSKKELIRALIRALNSFIQTYTKYINKYNQQAILQISAPTANIIKASWDALQSQPIKAVLSPEKAKLIAKNHGFSNADFAAALRSNNEIYIRGEYYAFEYYKYSKLFEQYFGLQKKAK